MSTNPAKPTTQLNNCFTGSSTISDLWKKDNCIDLMQAYVYSDNTRQFNYQNYLQGQEMTDSLFNWYLSNYIFTDNISDPQWNSFQDDLVQLCTTIPGICDNSLANNICLDQQKGEYAGSSIMTSFCGCYGTLPSFAEYSQYVLGTTGCITGQGVCQACSTESSTCTQIAACDPLCNRSSTVRKPILIPDPVNGGYTDVKEQLCPQNTCVIDDVVINIRNSNVPGGINFNNECTGCGIGNLGCSCIISGVDINTTMASIGVGTNFNNLCPSSVCIQGSNKVECNINPDQAQVTNDKVQINWILLFVTFIITIILVIIVAVLVKKSS